MDSFSPTPQQIAAVEAAKTGENLVITAGAGSGKTSTLRLIADALAPKKGVYIAYNKAIATDAAGSFPANVTCRTAHSFAYRAVGHQFAARLKSPRCTGRILASLIGIDGSYKLPADREIPAARVAQMVMATINKWCHSADPTIAAKHAAGVVNDLPGAEDISWELAEMLAKEAQRVWTADLSKPEPVFQHSAYDGRSGRSMVYVLPFSHDMYVKVWALGSPTLPGDFVLYDEAQDADPCIAGVVLAQKNTQLIAVGDECQAIYGWRGATDAMKSWPAKHRVCLSKSFRFGPAIAAEANVFLSILNAPLRIEGFDKIDSIVGPVAEPTAILCRTNAALIEQAMSFHLSRTFAIVGGVEQIKKFAEAAEGLMSGRRQGWHADLGVFNSWGDVLDYVKNDDGGSDLRSMVNVIESFGVADVLAVCDKAVPEARADVVLSTAHKSKGREWDHVRIADDFEPSEDREGGLSRSEAMLMYVAVTRAKLSLDCSALNWARGLTIETKEVAT